MATRCKSGCLFFLRPEDVLKWGGFQFVRNGASIPCADSCGSRSAGEKDLSRRVCQTGISCGCVGGRHWGLNPPAVRLSLVRGQFLEELSEGNAGAPSLPRIPPSQNARPQRECPPSRRRPTSIPVPNASQTPTARCGRRRFQ